ncbi:hypothetical protein IIA29_01600 [candidate division KSB1 bacterium]|nr:hypothetical protein [candidate division KSB1 bacterium]
MSKLKFEFIKDIAQGIREALQPHLNQPGIKTTSHTAFSGDTTFEIDTIAEDTLHAAVAKSNHKMAYFSEDKGLVKFEPNPQWLLVVDPIDGTRPLACGFETAVVSIALCDYSEVATFGSLLAGVIVEIKDGHWHYAERGCGVQTGPFGAPRVRPSGTAEIENMFWSFDIIGRPTERVLGYLGGLIDATGMNAAAFLFNSSAYSLTRIVTGQLDAYVDVGARILQDIPESEAEFVVIGRGQIMGTFPYDIAAAYIIVQEANCIITDAYGQSLDRFLLIRHGKSAVISCVVASNRELHRKILNEIARKGKQITSKDERSN